MVHRLPIITIKRRNIGTTCFQPLFSVTGVVRATYRALLAGIVAQKPPFTTYGVLGCSCVSKGTLRSDMWQIANLYFWSGATKPAGRPRTLGNYYNHQVFSAWKLIDVVTQKIKKTNI